MSAGGRSLVRCAFAVALSIACSRAEAAGPLDQRGAAKAVTCSACHGVAGNSRSAAMPIIAGLDAVMHRVTTGHWGATATTASLQAAATALNLGPARFVD